MKRQTDLEYAAELDAHDPWLTFENALLSLTPNLSTWMEIL